MGAVRYPIAIDADAAVKASRLKRSILAERERDAALSCGQSVLFCTEYYGPVFECQDDAHRHWEAMLGPEGYWRIQAISIELRKRRGPKRRKPSPPPFPLMEVQWQLRMDYWRPVKLAGSKKNFESALSASRQIKGFSSTYS
jgi:hypothetical protein